MSGRFLYVAADTALHRLHPNTKLLCLVLLFVAVMAFNHPLGEAGLLVLAVALLAAARALGNLRSSLRFLGLLFVVSAALWVLFVKDIKESVPLCSLQPVLVEVGTPAYDLMIVFLMAGLLMLAIVTLSLLQLVVHELGRGRGSAGWWVVVGVLALVGGVLSWRCIRLVPHLWVWRALLVAYFLALSVAVLARMRSPYALALWLGLLLSASVLYVALDSFLVHLNSEATRFIWGPTLMISRQALLYGLAMGLRIVSFLCFGLLYISTTTPEELTQGLRAMGMPLAPSVALSLAFRLVPTFAATARTVMDAQRARGLDLDAARGLTRVRRAVPVIVPTLAYALRSAGDLTRALETRGLGAAKRRTEYRPLTAGPWDVWAVVLVVLLAAGCVVARKLGIGELLPRL